MPHRFTNRLKAVIAAMIAVPLLAGCAASSGDSAAAEPPIDVRPITSSGQIDLPLARYAAPIADERAYFAAVTIAQARCAAKYGVESTIPVPEPNALVERASRRRYGVVDAEDVATYGYLPPPTPGGSDEKVPGQGWNPSARERLVMHAATADGGPVATDPETGKELPEHGCAAEGFRDVTQGQTSPALNTLVQDLLAEAWGLTMADSRALAAAGDWSACMSEHGYDFGQRWEAGNSVGGKPQQVQIAMAKLDLQCAQDTDYIEVWYAVDSAYQERLIAEHEGELRATLADRAAVMERVRDILRAGS